MNGRKCVLCLLHRGEDTFRFAANSSTKPERLFSVVNGRVSTEEQSGTILRSGSILAASLGVFDCPDLVRDFGRVLPIGVCSPFAAEWNGERSSFEGCLRFAASPDHRGRFRQIRPNCLYGCRKES